MWRIRFFLLSLFDCCICLFILFLPALYAAEQLSDPVVVTGVGMYGSAAPAVLFGVSFSSDGSAVFACDAAQNSLLKYDAVTFQLVPGFTSATAGLSLPLGVCIDPTNRVYVADSGNNRVVQLNGTTGVLLQSFSNSLIPNLLLSGPRGCAVTSRFLFISDTGNHRILKIDLLNDTILTIMTSASLGNSASFLGVAVDSLLNVFAADFTTGQIVKWNSSGSVVPTFSVVTNTSLLGLRNPTGVALNTIIPLGSTAAVEVLTVINFSSNQLLLLNASSGAVLYTFFTPINPASLNGVSSFPFSPGLLTMIVSDYEPRISRLDIALSSSAFSFNVSDGHPYAVALDGQGGILVDCSYNNITKVNYSGVQQAVFTTIPALDSPLGLVTDSAGALYVADSLNNRVVKFAPNGSLLNVFVTNNPTLNTPYGVTLDKANNIYIVDTCY